MMETAVEHAAAASRPIYLFADPATRQDALANQMAFCDEARRTQIIPPLTQQVPTCAAPGSDSATDTAAVEAPTFRPINKIPRMKKCHGWLTMKSEMLMGFPLRLGAELIQIDMNCTRFMQGGREYTAVVYEYVEEGDSGPVAVQEALDFFWLTGFSATSSTLVRNWMSNVLIDLSDIVPPRGYVWQEHYYKPRDAATVLTIGVGLENNRFFGIPGTPEARALFGPGSGPHPLALRLRSYLGLYETATA